MSLSLTRISTIGLIRRQRLGFTRSLFMLFGKMEFSNDAFCNKNQKGLWRPRLRLGRVFSESVHITMRAGLRSACKPNRQTDGETSCWCLCKELQSPQTPCWWRRLNQFGVCKHLSAIDSLSPPPSPWQTVCVTFELFLRKEKTAPFCFALILLH